MKTVNIVDAYWVDIFVEMNDYEDIKCGGSPTLGYDFYVSVENDKKELERFITESLKKHKRYYQRISITKVKDFREDKLWSLDKIDDYIKKVQVS